MFLSIFLVANSTTGDGYYYFDSLAQGGVRLGTPLGED